MITSLRLHIPHALLTLVMVLVCAPNTSRHDWTLGANWYLTQHFKFQANYIRAKSDKGNLSIDPRIFELRAQIYF